MTSSIKILPAKERTGVNGRNRRERTEHEGKERTGWKGKNGRKRKSHIIATTETIIIINNNSHSHGHSHSHSHSHIKNTFKTPKSS
jgi:hypothetical protein